MSYARSKKKAATVRVPEGRMRQLMRVMRARKLDTQSALINTLLEEEAERLASRKALAESVGAAGPRDLLRGRTSLEALLLRIDGGPVRLSPIVASELLRGSTGKARRSIEKLKGRR